jgi:hypothetical protein
MNGDLRIFPDLEMVIVALSNLDPPAADRLVDYYSLRMPGSNGVGWRAFRECSVPHLHPDIAGLGRTRAAPNHTTMLHSIDRPEVFWLPRRPRYSADRKLAVPAADASA